MKESMVDCARKIIGSMIEFQGIALDDLEPDLVADNMLSVADEVHAVARNERQRFWDKSYCAAAQALADLKQA